MKEEEWRTARNSRSLRYAQRVLDPRRWIVLRAGRGYLSRYDGQVALLTAANLFARMTPAWAPRSDSNPTRTRPAWRRWANGSPSATSPSPREAISTWWWRRGGTFGLDA